MVQYLGAVTSGSMDTLAPKARGGLGSQTRRPRELPGEGSWTELGPLATIEPQNRSWEQTYTQNFLSSLPPIFCMMKHEKPEAKTLPVVAQKASLCSTELDGERGRVHQRRNQLMFNFSIIFTL